MISYGQASDKGMVSLTNQDAVYSYVMSGSGAFSYPDIGLFIVADGLGIESEAITHSIIQTISNYLQRFLILPLLHNYLPPVAQQLLEILCTAFEEANQQIRKAFYGKGATATLAFLFDTQIFIAHVGNTAALVLHNDKLFWKSKIHDIAQGLVDTGEYESREAVLKSIRDSDAIYSAFGRDDRLPSIDSFSEALPQESALLLCSAALYKTLSESEIIAIVSKSFYPQDACQRLIDAVNAKNGGDNVSVTIVSNEFPFKKLESE